MRTGSGWQRLAAAAAAAAPFIAATAVRGQETERVVTAAEARAGGAVRPYLFRLDWRENARPRVYRLGESVAKSQRFSVEVTRFNFARYDLAPTVRDSVLPTYRALERLWRQVLSPVPQLTIEAERRAADAFLAAFRAWRVAIDTIAVRHTLRMDQRIPAGLALGDADSVTLARERAAASAELLRLDSTRAAAYGTIIDTARHTPEQTYYAQQLYDSELERHDTLVAALRAFVARAAMSERGRRFEVGTRAPGTLVTVTLEARALDATDTTAVRRAAAATTTIEYVVRSELPVVFHSGVAGVSISDLITEKVQVDGSDLFRQIAQPKESAELTAFLSYALTDPAAERGVLVTLGTDLAEPGKRLYAGVTAQLRRHFFATAGTVTREVEEGVDNVTADLFRTIRGTRRWGWFIALSASPFQEE